MLSFSFDNHLQVVNSWKSLLVFLNLNCPFHRVMFAIRVKIWRLVSQHTEKYSSIICVRSVNIPETPCTPNWFLSKRFIAESHICERLATRFLPVFREKGISKNFSISLSITTLNVSRFLSRENSHKQPVWVISDWMLSTKLAGHFPSFHVYFFFLRLFLCCFFLQVEQIASNSHRKHVLRAYM